MCRKKNGAALLLSICITFLTACAGGEDISEAQSASQTDTAATTAAAVSSAADETQSKAPVETQRITAEVTDLKGGSLTFTYEGEEYTLPLGAEKFVNSAYHLADIGINELIINNPYGIKITADIEITKDMSEIIKCDVETNNGETATSDIHAAYYMRHYEGSVYTIESDKETYYIDLNGLSNNYKDTPPEDSEVTFYGFALDGDKLVTDSIVQVIERTEDAQGNVNSHGVVMSNQAKYHYCGVVRSLAEDKAVIKLNYMDKLLTVPPYLTDGELKEGAQVIVVLRDTPEELAASKEQERDFAVFYTDPGALLTEDEEFEKTAYLKARQPHGYDVTMTDEINS